MARPRKIYTEEELAAKQLKYRETQRKYYRNVSTATPEKKADLRRRNNIALAKYNQKLKDEHKELLEKKQLNPDIESKDPEFASKYQKMLLRVSRKVDTVTRYRTRNKQNLEDAKGVIAAEANSQ